MSRFDSIRYPSHFDEVHTSQFGAVTVIDGRHHSNVKDYPVSHVLKRSFVVLSASLAFSTFAVGPVAAAANGSLGSLTGGSSSVQNAEEMTSEEAFEAYKNLDTDSIRAQDPVSFDRKLDLLSTSSGLNEMFELYSVDPEGERERIAALMDENSIRELVDKTDGKHIVIQPESDQPFTIVDEPPLRPAACWKSYVGIGAFTMVTGFHCALTGGLAPVCLILAANVGHHINWDRHC